MYLKQLAFQKLIIITSFFAISCSTIIDQNVTQTRPNILFITDDQSWIHNSFGGNKPLKRLVLIVLQEQEFILKMLFVLLPVFSSRGAIITGQEIWRLGEAAQLFSAVPEELSNRVFHFYLKPMVIISDIPKKDGTQQF